MRQRKDWEFARDCPVCGRLQHGANMAGPDSAAYWHADGSPDNCGPEPIDTHLVLKSVELGFHGDPDSITAEITTPLGTYHGRLHRKKPTDDPERDICCQITSDLRIAHKDWLASQPPVQESPTRPVQSLEDMIIEDAKKRHADLMAGQPPPTVIRTDEEPAAEEATGSADRDAPWWPSFDETVDQINAKVDQAVSAAAGSGVSHRALQAVVDTVLIQVLAEVLCRLDECEGPQR